MERISDMWFYFIFRVATVANCILNVLVICKYPDYFAMLRKESEEMKNEAFEQAVKEQLGGIAKE